MALNVLCFKHTTLTNAFNVDDTKVFNAFIIFALTLSTCQNKHIRIRFVCFHDLAFLQISNLSSSFCILFDFFFPLPFFSDLSFPHFNSLISIFWLFSSAIWQIFLFTTILLLVFLNVLCHESKPFKVKQSLPSMSLLFNSKLDNFSVGYSES